MLHWGQATMFKALINLLSRVNTEGDLSGDILFNLTAVQDRADA